MAAVRTMGGTKVYKFDATDKREMGHNFNYAIVQNGKIKGFKNLSQVNKAIGARLNSRSFKKK